MKKFALALALVLTASGFAQLKTVSYQDGKQKLNGIFAAPPTVELVTSPGILILPAWMGIQAHEKEVAEKLAEMGYKVFIADIYGEGNYPKNTDDAGKLSGKFKTDYALYQKRIQLALDQLVKQGANANEIVAIGYCFGGTGVLEMARSNMKVKGVVSFHGGLAKDKSRANGEISTKVLVLHGADDKFVGNIEDFQNEMREGKADWQMNYYADAVHAFTEKSAGNDKSKGVAYNEKADKRSWQAFLEFLDETL